MTYEEAIQWYRLGLDTTLLVVAGPFLVVVVARWAKSFLANS